MRKLISFVILSLIPAAGQAVICHQTHRHEHRLIESRWIRNANTVWLYLVDIGYKAHQNDALGLIEFIHPQRLDRPIVISNEGMIDRTVTLSKQEVSNILHAVYARRGYVSPSVANASPSLRPN